MTDARAQWQAANQRHLMSCLEISRARLQIAVGQPAASLELLETREQQARNDLPLPSAIQELARRFHLTAFEREVLLLCAAYELLPDVAGLCSALNQDVVAAYPTVRTLLGCIPEPAWSALTPEGTLRKLHLLEAVGDLSLFRRRLQMPERVLHYLCGVQYTDEQLNAVKRVREHSEPARSQRAAAEMILRMWSPGSAPYHPIQLIGEDVATSAALAARQMNLELHRVKAGELRCTASEFTALWNREAVLHGAVLLLEADTPDATALVREIAAAAGFFLLIGATERLDIPKTRIVEIEPPTQLEMSAVWRRELGPAAADMNGCVDRLVGQFRLTPSQISAAAAAVTAAVDREAALWSACRKQARGRLDGLATRIQSNAGWADIVLPETQSSTLREIVSQVRNRHRVYETWGFAKRRSRGLGISALFSGVSGTGKTLAAEVLAGELDLDLYHIDLSQVVSKYIGETEKNLQKIFNVAEGSGAVLLFDEADALFGKRSEVRDSHDRYANIEVGYLLQRMESYGGLVILTTNMKSALDPAFLRRIRFVVQFPFPESSYRRRIWQCVFPAEAPLADIDFEALSELSVTGGSIANIAMSAAFFAAEEGSAVSMQHIERAARGEFAKLERPLSDARVRGVQ